MVCTAAGKVLVETITIANPLNNSYIPNYLYLRLVATVYDEKAFVSMVSNGEVDLCISNKKHKRCGFNVLEEIRIDPYIYLDSNNGDSDDEDRTLQLQFNLRRRSSHSFDSHICTATLNLKCCVRDEVFEEQSNVKRKKQVLEYSNFIDSIIEHEPIFTTRRPSSWSNCDERNIVYLMGIKSYALNFQLRQAIRNSYLSEDMKSIDMDYYPGKKCARFIVGTVEGSTVHDAPNINHLLQMEQAVFGDLLLNDEIPGVIDSYHNLVRKVMAFLNWLSDNNPPKYVIITDDDVYVNMSDLTLFLSSAPVEKLYTGETIYNRKPMRDRNHSNYLSVENWPEDELIPFVAGNFYILSSDAVTLLVNHKDTEILSMNSVGDLEDVSIAAWLRSVDILPTPLDNVLPLKLSPHQMDMLVVPPQFMAVFDVRLHEHFSDIHNFVLSSQHTSARQLDSKDSLKIAEYSVFISPQSLYAALFINRMLQQVRPLGTFYYHTLGVDGDWDSLEPSKRQVDFLIVSPNDAIIDAGNSIIDEFDSNRLLALQYIVNIFEVKEQIILMSGEALNFSSLGSLTTDGGKDIVDVLITTINDMAYLPKWSHHREELAHGRSPICTKVSCWNEEGRIRILYVPVITLAFAEMTTYKSPHFARHLLHPRGLEWAARTKEGKLESAGVAYLYHRCSGGLREERETFYRLLMTRLPNSTIALGRCGRDSNDRHNFESKRFSQKYLDEAIGLYRPFKFVVAFENSLTSGYITEKLVLAYLAGSIPIYFGTRDVEHYFNMKSMIYCGSFPSLENCANRIKEISGNDDLYLQVLAEPAITSGSKFNDLFSWIL